MRSEFENTAKSRKEFEVIPEPVRPAIAYKKETNGQATSDSPGRHESRYSGKC